MHINLKTAKKIDGDKDSSTFRTKEGHEFKVVHKALSPGARKEISSFKFADGGSVAEPDPKKAKEMEAGASKSGDPIYEAAKSGVQKLFGMADGGYVDTITSGDPIVKAVKGRAPEGPNREGSDWSSKPTPSPKDPKEEEYKASVKAFNSQTAKPMAEGGDPRADTPEKIAADAASQAEQPQAPVTINIGQPQGQPIPAAQAGQEAAGSIKSILPLLAGPTGAALATAATNPPPQSALDFGQGLRSGFTGEQLPQEASEGAPSGPTLAGAPESSQTPANTPSTSPTPNPYQTALQEQVKGLEMGEKAQEQAAQGKEQALAEYNKNQASATNTYDANIKDAMNLRQSAMDALQSGKIDPDRYWNSKSTGGQISTMIGILAAGFNPTHNPNAAIDMLNKQIDRDIETQRMDLGRKQTLLSAANDHFRNIQSAADFHRVLANDLVSHQIDQSLAKAATPAAQAELLKARGALNFDSQMRMAQIGAMQTLNGTSSPDEQSKALNTLRLVAPEKAKEYEARIIPGVGTATVPVPDKKREAFAAADTFMKQMDELEKFRQAHKGTVVDRGVVDQGHRLAELARNSFRIAQGEGVFKEGSAKFNERLIPDPTDFDFFNKNKAAYGAMKDQAKKEVDSSASVYGIKPAQNSVFAEGAHLNAQEKTYLDWAKRNPGTPEAKAVFKKLGINQ